MGQARKTNGSSGEGLDEACAELLELTARLEERLELLHEESRRAAETLTRVKLAAEFDRCHIRKRFFSFRCESPSLVA